MHKHMFLCLALAAVGCASQQAAVTGSSTAPTGPLTPAGTVVVAQDGQLVKLDSEGRRTQTLTSGFQDSSPAFSPSGTHLIFSRAGDIYRINARDGSEPVNLTPNLASAATDPVYSPDGRYIAFSSQVGRDPDLYVMNADGTGVQSVTSGPEQDRRPTFSPDGRTLFFQRAHQVYSVPTAGGTPVPVADGTYPQYAPGDLLLFSRHGDLWTVRNGVEDQVTRSTPPIEFVGQAAQSSIYALAADAPSAEPQGDLYVLDADGSNQRRLTTGLRASALAVSPQAGNAGPSPSPGVTLIVANNTSVTMYAYVFGYNNGTPSYLSNDGTVQAYSSGTIPSIASVASNTTSQNLTMPLFTMARIYFSNNPSLQFTAFEESPALGSNQLYDFVEYNYPTLGGTFTADTSCVEAFALPFQIETSPAGTVNGLTVPAGMGPGVRSQIFTAMKALGAPWTSLIVGNNTRILAPWNGNLAVSPSPGPFPTNYLDPSIALQWGGNLTLNTYLANPPQYYVANASSGSWTFAPQSGSGANVTFASPPTTTQAFSCNIPFTSSDQGLGARIRSILAAGLNRGTLLFPNPSPAPIPFTPVTAGQPDFSPVDFYQPGNTRPNVPQVNEYAKVMHANSLSGYQYGFASDDQGSQSSTITVNSGIQSFTVTIQSF